MQERTRAISRRARRAEDSAYCGYIRNIEFNAWHYADANLWASLIDEHSGALDRFLADDSGDAAEYQAVLIMLVTIIAFPDQAPVLLLALARLDAGDGPDARPWAGFVAELGRCGPRLRESSRFLAETTAALPGAEAWTREPFRRWAVEVSRYSFATGQEVFARADRARAR